MKCNNAVTPVNNEVLKMPLPNKPTHVAIQLGLPSGTKWATMNVGATKEEEYGEFYAWGEVEPSTDYSNAYCKTQGLATSTLKSKGYVLSNGELAPLYDAATQNWGGNWKMPSKKDFNELLNKSYCNISLFLYGTVWGYKFESKINHKWLFLPNTGHKEDKDYLEDKVYYDKKTKETIPLSEYGRAWYWCSTESGNTASADTYTSVTTTTVNNQKVGKENPSVGSFSRYAGRAIRAVIAK